MNIDKKSAYLLKRVFSERFITLTLSLALLSLVMLLAPPLVAETKAARPSAPTPIDKEQDMQSKLRLQEKIARELEENRQNVLKRSSEKAGEKSSGSTGDRSSDSSHGTLRDNSSLRE